MKEIWETIIPYPNYQVSNFGRIRSIDRFVSNNWRNGQKFQRGKILKPQNNARGYYHVCLYHNGKKITKTIHFLVATYFIDNPLNKPQVNHKDGVKTNNFDWNLEWNTAKENIQHGYAIGLISSDHSNKPVYQIKNGIIINTFKSAREATRKTNVAYQGIYSCCIGRYKHSGGFQWEYANKK